MRSVFKYQVDITDVTAVQIEANAEWYIATAIDPERPLVWHVFR